MKSDGIKYTKSTMFKKVPMFYNSTLQWRCKNCSELQHVRFYLKSFSISPKKVFSFLLLSWFFLKITSREKIDFHDLIRKFYALNNSQNQISSYFKAFKTTSGEREAVLCNTIWEIIYNIHITLYKSGMNSQRHICLYVHASNNWQWWIFQETLLLPPLWER
jgi:hypothetical protein